MNKILFNVVLTLLRQHFKDQNPMQCRLNNIWSLCLHIYRTRGSKTNRYFERDVRIQILSARGFSRDSLLDRENTREEQNKMTFNLTYYPVFQNVKKILAELHLLLTPDVAHKAVFTNVPIIGFKNDRRGTNVTFNILKDPLDSNHVIYLNVSNVNIAFLM